MTGRECELHLQIGESRPGTIKESDTEAGDYWVCEECHKGEGP
jgi:hypothetical protein